jgi:hypothetical protein
MTFGSITSAGGAVTLARTKIGDWRCSPVFLE